VGKTKKSGEAIRMDSVSLMYAKAIGNFWQRIAEN
jgi:hypothetical protein